MTSSAELRAALAGPGEGFESQRLRTAVAARLFRSAPPTKLGRYAVGALLGRGGMGSVYAAFDPLLQRHVAIKLLTDEGPDGSETPLHREAEALAALAHPNVVSIYELGSSPHGAYVVMELVEGMTLSQWLEQHPDPAPRFSETLGLLIQAARGLAAAHASGLVHRDVKPSNILIGHDHDGAMRARVADFGLAQACTELPTPPSDDDTRPSLPVIDRAGTPRYMSPEQIDGAVADARSDQFSFCVMAFESLFGVAPFGGHTLHLRRLAIERGPIRPVLRNEAQRRAEQALRAGLAEAPSARYHDMPTLIARLERAGARARPVLAPALALLSAVGIGGLALAGNRELEPRAADPCAGESPAATWWQQDGEVRLAAARSQFPTTAAQIDTLDATLLRNRVHHDDAWRRACAAATLAERDARLACLAAHRSQTQQVFEALVSDPIALREQGAAAIESVPDATRCNRADASAEPSHLEADQEIARVLTSADLAMRAGDDHEARAFAFAGWMWATSIGQGRLQARAELLLGDLDRDAGHMARARDWFERGHATATAVTDDAMAVRAAVAVARTEPTVRGRAAWVRAAEAAMTRAGHDAELEGLYWSMRGDDALRRTEDERAIEHHRHALAIRLAHDQGDRMKPVENMVAISDALARLARHDEALAWAQDAEQLATRVLGRGHVSLLNIQAWRALLGDDAGSATQLATIERELRDAVGEHSRHYLSLQHNLAAYESKHGNLDAARTRLERALERALEADQDEGIVVAGLQYQLGWLALRHRDLTAAHAALAASIDTSERLDPGGPKAVSAQIALAEVAARQRDWTTAIGTLGDALARLGEESSDPRQANAKAKLASVLFDSGDPDAARPMIAEAEEAVAASFGPRSQRMAELLQLRGDVEQHDGKPDVAIATYAEAERIMLALDRRIWSNIGYGRLRQADLHWSTGDRATARAFANAAIAAYQQEPAGAAGVAEARAWLAGHRAPRR
ncbi:MAG: protein kinase [Deltaproteobacteria bacterium]|nr:protein kinase [Deltaproteobacteria bacterium]